MPTRAGLLGPPSTLLTLAKTSILGGAASGSIQELLEQSAPGFGTLQKFFKTWLRLDITSIAVAVTLLGMVSGATQDIQEVAMKLYWWVAKFLTASISIAGNDRLNKEVLNWIASNVLMRQGTRILTARSETLHSDVYYYFRREFQRNDYLHEKRVPVQFLPTFGTIWFIHARRLFLVSRVSPNRSKFNSLPDEYADAPEGDEPLVIMCLGRSVTPIKKFLDTCRNFADKQTESFITVRASKSRWNDEAWNTTILRPIRPLETVHFDEKVKEDLILDIRNYLDPITRRFYSERGIPYRRGVLLHGPPGTGKTSLSLALAGLFGLELYLVHIPSIREDSDLERLFLALPPRCIVLLEDIDAVGMKRQPDPRDDWLDSDDEDDDDDFDPRMMYSHSRSRCTLSGLLNVLDGVTSQEGRIVLMTSNMADKLDEALIRPGRIDRKVFLGYISPRCSELMFLRMYARGTDSSNPQDFLNISEDELKSLAQRFSEGIPEDLFTPAQLQGYLLNHQTSPVRAADSVGTWVREEMGRMEEAKALAKKQLEREKKKRKRDRLRRRANQMAIDKKVEDDLEAAKKRKEEKEEEAKKKAEGVEDTSDDDKEDAKEESSQEEEDVTAEKKKKKMKKMKRKEGKKDAKKNKDISKEVGKEKKTKAEKKVKAGQENAGRDKASRDTKTDKTSKNAKKAELSEETKETKQDVATTESKEQEMETENSTTQDTATEIGPQPDEGININGTKTPEVARSSETIKVPTPPNGDSKDDSATSAASVAESQTSVDASSTSDTDDLDQEGSSTEDES